MKDMQPNSEVIYRPNAIRALCRIIDVRLKTLLFLCDVDNLTLLTYVFQPAIDGTRCRTILQSRYCRPQPLHLLRRTRLSVPPLPLRKGRRQTLGERSPRSHQHQKLFVQLLRRLAQRELLLPRLRVFLVLLGVVQPGQRDEPAHPVDELYHAVPCPWVVVCDQTAG